MPRTTYQSILKNTDPYNLKQLSRQSTTWFIDELKRIRQNRFDKDYFVRHGQQDTVKRLVIGKIYMFSYSAKNYDTLPAWDRFPLVLPFNTTADGFIGINLHYVPTKWRAWLLDNLMRTANVPNNQLRVTWGMLSGFSRTTIGQYATHQYLLNHITSPFRLVRIEDYPKAIMLPLASWYGNDKRMISKFRNMV